MNDTKTPLHDQTQNPDRDPNNPYPVDYLGGDIFKRLRDNKNPYVGPHAEQQEMAARAQIPFEASVSAIRAVEEAGYEQSELPKHNVMCLAAGHACIEHGFRAIDSHSLDLAGKPTGANDDCKSPRGAKWGSEATTDIDYLNQRFLGIGQYPANKKGEVYDFPSAHAMRNVSVMTGGGLFILDLDGPEGAKWLDDQEEVHGKLPQTARTNTGGGGSHLYFRATRRTIRNSASKIAPKVDIRGEGGQAPVPPSMHKSGNRYLWVDGCAPWQCGVADAPEWLEEAAFRATKANQPKGKKSKKGKRENKKRGAESSTKLTKGVGKHLSLIGDGEGLSGFDGPIYSAACAYFAREGCDASSTSIKTKLLHAILSAPCKDDRAESRYATDDYLDNRIEQAREFIAENSYNDQEASFDITDPLGDTLEEAMGTLDRGFRFVNIGGEGKFIRHLRRGDAPKLEVWNKTALANWYADRKIFLGQNKVNAVPIFFNNAQRWDGTAFAPYPAEISPSTYNLFRGFSLEPRDGDCSKLKEFILEIICDGDEEDFKWLWHWMAHLVQRPGEKPKTALVLWGEGGIGKGTFGRLLRALVHPYGTTLGDADAVVGRWSGERHALNLVCVSEEAVFSGDRRVANALKHKVDHEECAVEVKNIQPIMMPSYTRYVFDSNHPDAINIEGNGSERRYFVRRVSNARKGDLAYFKEIRDEIEGDGMRALFAELMAYDPADAGMAWSDVLMAPETHDRKAMERETMRPVYRAFASMMDDGEFYYESGPEKYRFVFDEGQTRIPKRMLEAFVAKHGDARQAAESDPSRIFEHLNGIELVKKRHRCKFYYRHSSEGLTDEWDIAEENVMSYDVRPMKLLTPP